jgi:hypothetical protein
MCEICRYQPLCPAVAIFFGFEEAAMRRRKRIEEVAAITAAVGIEARPHGVALYRTTLSNFATMRLHIRSFVEGTSTLT